MATIRRTHTTSVNYFDFKKFRIYHDRCAMKVGTDGVLLGAWADVSQARNILDIGCGSGLIALMAAQRSNANITGVEIDPDAARQAADNCRQSPFARRITIIHSDICQFTASEKFDCILTNPPYFDEKTLPPGQQRATARHTSALNFAALVQHACRLMTHNALFQLILPHAALGSFLTEISHTDLALLRRTDVITRQGKRPKRTLLCLANTTHPVASPHFDTLELFDDSGRRSEAYARLTHEFYLHK